MHMRNCTAILCDESDTGVKRKIGHNDTPATRAYGYDTEVASEFNLRGSEIPIFSWEAGGHAINGHTSMCFARYLRTSAPFPNILDLLLGRTSL